MAHPLADINARLVIAHRGDRVQSPENTMEALIRAVDLGADALEFDVRMTRDDVPVLMHDPALDRTTTGRGLLRDHSLAELGAVDASRGGPAWTGAKVAVPTLEEILDRFRGVPIVIDVKEPAVASATIRLVHAFGLQDTVVVGSEDAEVIAQLYRSGLSACASRADALRLLALAVLGLTPRSPAYAVASLTPRFNGWPVPMLRMAASARRAGVATHVWTVNDPDAAAKLWRGGVSGIITDDVPAMLRARPQ